MPTPQKGLVYVNFGQLRQWHVSDSGAHPESPAQGHSQTEKQSLLVPSAQTLTDLGEAFS